jgi:hypothetical protein
MAKLRRNSEAEERIAESERLREAFEAKYGRREKRPEVLKVTVPTRLPPDPVQELRRAGIKTAAEVAPPPEPWRAGPKRLTIVERDGRESVIDLPPESEAYLMVQWTAPQREAPWVREQHAARVGVFSIERFELVDVDPDEAA